MKNIFRAITALLILGQSLPLGAAVSDMSYVSDGEDIKEDTSQYAVIANGSDTTYPPLLQNGQQAVKTQPVNDITTRTTLSKISSDSSRVVISEAQRQVVPNPIVTGSTYNTPAPAVTPEDVMSTSGEIVWQVDGKEKKVEYSIESDSYEDALMSLQTLKQKYASLIHQEVSTTPHYYCSLGSPKTWSAQTTPGEIHYADWADGRHYFESLFAGNAKKISAYYPENNKSNNYWKVIHPKEYYVVTSDPQYARTAYTVDDEKNAKPVILKQYQEINRIKSLYGDAFKGTIINGDITDFGHRWQWNTMDEAFKTLNHDYWYGLGNHDYANNVNDCYQNNCAIRSIRNLIEHIKTRKNVQSVDYTAITGYKFPSLTTDYTGSFSYTFDISGIRFIQLNNYLDYTTDYSGFVAEQARRYNVHVISGREWYEEQLADARKKGKAIVVLSHNGNYNNGDALFAKYEATTEFYGHTHKLAGSGRAFNSGATFLGDFLFIEVNNISRQMNVYAVRNNDFSKRQLLSVANLKVPVTDLTPYKQKAFTITLKNGGGYIGIYNVNYTREDGSKSSTQYRLALGNSVQIQIPRAASNINVHGATRNGRFLYDTKLNDYKNVCLKSWGTLPRNLKWGWC